MWTEYIGLIVACIGLINAIIALVTGLVALRELRVEKDIDATTPKTRHLRRMLRSYRESRLRSDSEEGLQRSIIGPYSSGCQLRILS